MSSKGNNIVTSGITLPIAESDVTALTTDLSTLTTNVALANKSFLALSKSGAITTAADCADYTVTVPFNMTLQKMKVTLTTAAAGAMVVQLRSAAGPITTAPTFGNVTGFSVTFANTNVFASSAPTGVNVSEGDVLGFSVTTGSGAGMYVEVTGIAR